MSITKSSIKKFVGATMVAVVLGGTVGANAQTWNVGSSDNPRALRAALNNGILTISGSGEMANYFCEGDCVFDGSCCAPWSTFNNFRHAESITTAIIEEGVRIIGYAAFAELRNLTRITIGANVEFGMSTSGIVGDFENVYNRGGKRAGTYVLRNNRWALVNVNDVTSLSRLNVSNGTLSPRFHRDSLNYTLPMLPNTDSVLTIEATPMSREDGVTVTGAGSKTLSVGDNTFRINVEAFGFNKTYTITVTRAARDAVIGTWNCGPETNRNAVTATLTGDGTLTIRGTGAMDNFTMTTIPWAASRNHITRVIIENGVTTIGNSAFWQFPNLTSVTIPNSVTSIGEGAFMMCTGLSSITIPNSVTSIGNAAFMGCAGLTSITIPNNVRTIGNAAFASTGLTSIDVASNNANYSVENGVLFNKNKTVLLQYPSKKQGTSYTIPNTVTSIGQSAFSGATNLTSVTIPNSVTSIGNQAFQGCTGLTSITIPNSVTSIGYMAFMGCAGLTSVTIPNSVTSIGYSAFTGATSLTSVTIPNSVTSISAHMFSGCRSLTSITIPNSVTSIGDAAFQGSGLTSIVIPNSVTAIGNMAFMGNASLTSITIPSSVTSIGSMAFATCTALREMRVFIPVPLTITPEQIQAERQTQIQRLEESKAQAQPAMVRSIDAQISMLSQPQSQQVLEAHAQTQTASWFQGSLDNACLYVPENSIAAYRSAAGWNTFRCFRAVP